MNPDHKNEEIKHPKRPTINGYRHRRNPSIRTLMNSKRYQQATPKIEQPFFAPNTDTHDSHDTAFESKMEPKIQRLESVINRLRIENSHTMSKSDTLSSKNALLQKSLKHSKQQYSLLESENKKLKNHNKYLQQRLNELKSRQRDDDDVMSIVSLKTQLTNLEDTHRKGKSKNKKIKKSLEDVINDPGLPSYLRNKLTLLLPNFRDTHSHSDSIDSSLSHMKFDLLSDNSPSSPIGFDSHFPIFETESNSPGSINGIMQGIIDILPPQSPVINTSQSAEKKSKLMHYKKRETNHKKNASLSLSNGTNGYTPKIQIIKPGMNGMERRKRSVSTISSHSYNSYRSGSEETYDEEEKQIISFSKFDSIGVSMDSIIPQLNRRKAPPLSPVGNRQRRKPPPPPRKGVHRKDTKSDDLSMIARRVNGIKTVTPNHLNLSQIDEDMVVFQKFQRLRSVSHDVHSPSGSSTKGIKGSPTKLKNLTLDTTVTSEDEQVHERGRSKKKERIPREKRVKYQRNKANTAFQFNGNTGHRRSKSHQRFGYKSPKTGSESDSDFSVDEDNTFEAKRNKFFHMGWKSKKKSDKTKPEKRKSKKGRRESIKVSKKEERNLTQRRNTLRVSNSSSHSHSSIARKPPQKLSQNKSHDGIVLNISALPGPMPQTRAHSAQPIDQSRARKRYSMSAQIGRNKKKKKKSGKNKHIMNGGMSDYDLMPMSKTSDADAMSDSLNGSHGSLTGAVMNINPLSPAISRDISSDNNDPLSNVIKYINQTESNGVHLLSSPESIKSQSNGNKLSIASMKMSVSTPNSPMRNPLQRNPIKPKQISVEMDMDINTVSRNLVSSAVLGRSHRKKTKSFSLQLTKNTNKDFYRNKKTHSYQQNKGTRQKKTFSREDITKREPKKQLPINTKTDTRITRMDLIKMSKLNKPTIESHKKRYSSPSIAIPKELRHKSHNSEKEKGRRNKRRSSFSFKSRKKTDHFEMSKSNAKNNELKPVRGRRSTHSRSMSLRGTKMDKFSFSLSPRVRRESQSRKDMSPERRKKSFHFRHTITTDERGSSDDSLEDPNKVWTLKDLIREMVSNAGYDLENRMRNALMLCHITFTTNMQLFTELRRFLRMSITEMTSCILYFEDEEDDTYTSADDRRWFMRQTITQCIIYWMDKYWNEDFAHNRELRTEIESFKSDIRSNIQDTNRSNTLLQSLMDGLKEIKNKYGGINPKNLNIVIGREDSKEDSKGDEDTSVVIHDSCDSDGDTTVVIEDGSFQRKKKTVNLMIQQRERTVSINNRPRNSLKLISQTTEAQNIIKKYNADRDKKELEKLTLELRKVEVRYPALMLLDIDISGSAIPTLMQLDPEDVAVQLTLLDSIVFKKIKARECIQQSWKKKDKAVKAPNILKMIAQFNDVSKWVQLTILNGETPRLRKRYIKKCISMATYFMNNGNLSSLCAFYNALTSNNILSLQASWKLLSKSKRKELQEIKGLFGWKMNKFKEIQEELQPPCIPHIGIILQVLFQIDEGKQSTNPSNHSINYIKMMMIHEEIYNLEILQSQHYRDEPNFLIQKLLIREFQLQNEIDDNQLYKLAKSVADSEKNQKK